MRYITKQYRYKRGFKNWLSNWWDETKVEFKVFWDFKYKKERKRKKSLLKTGEMEKIPVEKAVKKDVKNMSYSANAHTSAMKYVKTKGGAVVVTPASMRDIRKDYKDAELVEARIKSHADVENNYCRDRERLPQG